MFFDVLSKIYNDPIDLKSLDGVVRPLRRASLPHVIIVTLHSHQKYLPSEQTYTLHMPARRRFISNYSYTEGIDAQWQANLVDMQCISKHNGGIRYFLN